MIWVQVQQQQSVHHHHLHPIYHYHRRSFLLKRSSMTNLSFLHLLVRLSFPSVSIIPLFLLAPNMTHLQNFLKLSASSILNDSMVGNEYVHRMSHFFVLEFKKRRKWFFKMLNTVTIRYRYFIDFIFFHTSLCRFKHVRISSISQSSISSFESLLTRRSNSK